MNNRNSLFLCESVNAERLMTLLKHAENPETVLLKLKEAEC